MMHMMYMFVASSKEQQNSSVIYYIEKKLKDIPHYDSLIEEHLLNQTLLA